ncbi:hypothetical protein HAX54_007544 [Datura stramonium]|uniref:Uncharacterized protein n=1 Tax=Datura stramonium TaxID=4076 RepID=A0ABS8TDB2_DATST|nr:hypothetical protein [Datura stramonium]
MVNLRENEVYSIDIVTSTGEGKPKLLDEKQTTIYKRAVDKSWQPEDERSRFIFSEISQKFPIMPFTARSSWSMITNAISLFCVILEQGFGRERACLGLAECVNHDLCSRILSLGMRNLAAFGCSSIKFTVLLMPNGSIGSHLILSRS